MNANAFRHFFEYHFAENRKIWDRHVMSLSQEHFTQPVDYSHGAVRNQLVHMMSADNYWFSGLRGVAFTEDFNPSDFDERQGLRAQWDQVEQTMQSYLAALQDENLFEHPFQEGPDAALEVWQILLHVVNHGTDHRAQVLRLLNDFGEDTGPQDYVFYVFDNG
jgi:uncharacterized damage-inducible protein DinB